MTIDEILAQVYNEQGFLVLASIEPYKIGEIIMGIYSVNNKYPMKCIALSTKEEFLLQVERMQILEGRPLNNLPSIQLYFYRVEPTD